MEGEDGEREELVGKGWKKGKKVVEVVGVVERGDGEEGKWVVRKMDVGRGELVVEGEVVQEVGEGDGVLWGVG
ncbi:hypothetical protein, partial [Kocuria rhizophila]|uniref:hypothetical protein n=1 Tax=Kocuria rhizophila TaxID=72000 RepID=UPI0011A5DBEA